VTIAELRALLAKADNLPWADDDAPMIKSVGLVDPERPSRGREMIAQAFGQNAALIVAAVNALPALLDVVDSLSGHADSCPVGIPNGGCSTCDALAKLMIPNGNTK